MSEIPFNTTPVPKTFDVFANDLKRNLDEYEDDHLASSTRSFKQLSTKSTTTSNNNQLIRETTNLAKFKTSLKILTSSIDKDLNMIKPPIPPPSTISTFNKNTDKIEIADPDEPRVVFNKTYTSWPIEDQQAQLNAFNFNDEDESEINNQTINLNTKKTNNENLNLTQDIIVQDLDDMMEIDENNDDENNNNRKQDLNLTREILTSSSSAISSVGSSLPSSKSTSRYSSMNNIQQKQSIIKNNNIERVLNRTRSINEDSDSELHNITIDKGSDQNNSNNKRKSTYSKPVIDPVEPPVKTAQSKLVQMYKNKPVSNLAKPSLLVNYTSKSLDSHKLPETAAFKKSTLNTLMNRTTVIETNDENSNKQTSSKLKHSAGIIPSKQSKLPSPVKSTAKSPTQTTNLPKFSQQQPTITKQLSVQKTTDTKSSLIPSPNSNRLSSASSTSSSSSLKENKKISPPIVNKSPNYSSTSKLKAVGLNSTNTANNKITTLNNINNQQQQQASKLKTIQITSLPKPSLMTNQMKTSLIPMSYNSSIPTSNLLQQK